MLKATIAWGNTDAIITLFAGRPESERAAAASLLVAEREQHWPLIRATFGAEPPRHRERSAWRAGLAALFATASLGQLLRLTETEHAYGEAYASPIQAIIEDRRPDWMLEWIDASLEHYPSSHLVALIDGLQDSGALGPVDLSPHLDQLLHAVTASPAIDVQSAAELAAVLHRHPLGTDPALVATDAIFYGGANENTGIWILAFRKATSLLNRNVTTVKAPEPAPSEDLSEPTVIGTPPPPTPLRALGAQRTQRPLAPGAVAIERRLAEQHATGSWHWQLTKALLETGCRHDHVAAQHHFSQAKSLSDDHPEVLAELGFFTDHVRKEKVFAERLYEQAIEDGPMVDYELYPPELTTMLRRPHYDHSATIAKYAAFLLRERDDVSGADQTLEQALFIRRRLGANPAAFEPDHIAFLRQLVVVAGGEASTSSLFGFDEWSGPSEMTFE